MDNKKNLIGKLLGIAMAISIIFCSIIPAFAMDAIYADASVKVNILRTNIVDEINKIILPEIKEKTKEHIKEQNRLEEKKKIADYACTFVGWLPYVWAEASLESGTDCCGFAMAVYNEFGYDIGRTVEVQATMGTSVNIEEAEPGDIVVYAGHVAMYIGDGQVVHAPYTGTTVSIESVYMMPILDIRRII